ncbi:MAG: hypothetical protein WBQ18_10880 [Solirubrobacteraceae bacterium]
MTDDVQPSEAELTRLADGTLPAARADELRAQAQRSPELAAELARQQQAVAMMRSLQTPAPAALLARVQAQTAGGRRRRDRGTTQPRRRIALTPGLVAAVLFVVVIAAELIVANQGPTPANIGQAARLALAASTQGPPAADPSQPGRLTIANAGLPFPDWTTDLGWRASGARVDTLGARRVVTVFYTGRDGTRVGYGIVSGAPLRSVRGTVVNRYGVPFTLDQIGSVRLVTWRRNGHTCVIAGRSVAYPVLLALAGADEHTAAT